MASFVDRMVGAAKLEVAMYEEVEADRGATGQAMGVVLISSLATGIGLYGNWSLGRSIIGAAAALVSWFLWAFLTYLIGTKLLPEPQTSADVGELLRTTGFSSSPGVLRILGAVPAIGALISFIVSIWMLVAMVIAVRQALDYRSTARAVGVCLIGWVVYVAASALFWNLGAG
jgi:Yip1 domain